MPAKSHQPPDAEAVVEEQQVPTAVPVKGQEPPSGLSADEERALGELQAKRAAAAAAGVPVRLKVEEPHSAVTFGGVTVGRDFTEVPAAVAADFVSGAADAGVTVTQDQEG
jgi:hypothetical protein